MYFIECWNAATHRWEALPASFPTATKAGEAAYLLGLPVGCARVARAKKKMASVPASPSRIPGCGTCDQLSRGA